MFLFILMTRNFKKKNLLINIFTINEYQSKQYSNFLLRPRITLGRGMSETNGTDSNGGYPPPPGPPMHNSYGSPYGGPGGPPPPPQGYPAKVPPQGGYPGTPTLNSLLQDRRYPPGYEQAGHGGPPPGGHGGPPGGPPGGHGVPPGGGPPTGGPAYPGWAYGHPGYRSQVIYI